MIKRKNIDRAELMQLAKMLLLLTNQQQITMAFLCPTDLKKEETVAHEHLSGCFKRAWFKLPA
jgi:hypothetical protein